MSAGGTFPDGGDCLRQGYVFILAAEDGKRDTIKPRLFAAGADMGNVAILKTKLTITAKDGKSLIDFVNFQNLAYWEGLFKKHKPVLLIADPVPAFMGPNVNDHRNADVRQVLEPFVDLLGHYAVAMEAITHVGKSTKDKSATDQILGAWRTPICAAGQYRVARSQSARSLHPDESETEHRQETTRYRLHDRRVHLSQGWQEDSDIAGQV